MFFQLSFFPSFITLNIIQQTQEGPCRGSVAHSSICYANASCTWCTWSYIRSLGNWWI